MKIFRLENFIRGWVVGDFEPTIIKTKDFEFAVQYFTAGQIDSKHIHKLACEITVIIFGEFSLNGQKLVRGDVAKIEPSDSSEFSCLTDGATAVVKIPSVKGDKYLVD